MTEKAPQNFRLWQPHNFRVIVSYKPPSGFQGFPVETDPYPHPHRGSFPVEVKGTDKCCDCTISNNGKQYNFKGYRGCTIQIFKTKAVIINNSHVKMWRVIKNSKLGEADPEIKEVVDDMDAYAVHVFRLFVEQFGGATDFKIINRRTENGFKGDPVTDGMPKDQVINSLNFKKVYDDHIEFKSTQAMENFIHNRTIDKVAPELALRLQHIDRQVSGVLAIQGNYAKTVIPVQLDLAKNMETHVAVMQDIHTALSILNVNLAKKRKGFIYQLFHKYIRR